MSGKPGGRVEVSEQDFEVNGITLHTFSWGKYTTPERAVFLVHGLTASSQSWVDYGYYLSERGYYALALDLRGRGLSDKPGHGFGLPYHAIDILGIADKLGWDRLNLVGHSLGAAIALFTAAVHPGRIRKLVLVDAGGKVPDDAIQALAPSLTRLGQSYPSLENYLDLFRQSPAFNWGPFWENYFSYDALVRPDGTVTSRVSKTTIEEELKVNAAINLEILVGFLKADTMILRATVGLLSPDRGFILTEEEAEKLKHKIPGSKLVAVPDRNHYTLALSDVFREEVTAFLA